MLYFKVLNIISNVLHQLPVFAPSGINIAVSNFRVLNAEN